MQTINSQLNFTGIYKIPNTPKNIKEIEEKVIPMYNYLKHENVSGSLEKILLFSGLKQ